TASMTTCPRAPSCTSAPSMKRSSRRNGWQDNRVVKTTTRFSANVLISGEEGHPMLKNAALSQEELEELDRFYRAGGLQRMASPHIHYHDSKCPHAGCNHGMEWIDFQLELHGEPERIYKPLVRAWWDGTGFAGRCPVCNGWIHFTSL